MEEHRLLDIDCHTKWRMTVRLLKINFMIKATGSSKRSFRKTDTLQRVSSQCLSSKWTYGGTEES